MLDVMAIRKDFPAISRTINDKPLVYLDSAATTQKPQAVLAAVQAYNEQSNANPNRGVYSLASTATEQYENARKKVARFINAAAREVIFTKNATEALNLIANSYGMEHVGAGDEILLCIAEHHSNIVPWQRVAHVKKAKLKYMYLTDDFSLSMAEVRAKITDRTKVVGITHMSNVLGTIFPIKDIVQYAHSMGAVVVVDGAQSVPHLTTDVQDLDADFLVFSGHKMLAPMGIGVLYGKEQLLEKMPPFLMGGDMIEYVEEQQTTFADLPNKFEAGTPNVEGAVGLGAAIDYLEGIGIAQIHQHEGELTAYALERLTAIPYIDVYGSLDCNKRGPVISFSIEGCHPHDVASIVDTYGVALRAGHHCAQPLMNYLKAPATSRVSFSLYNTKDEIDVLVNSLVNVRRWLGYES